MICETRRELAAPVTAESRLISRAESGLQLKIPWSWVMSSSDSSLGGSVKFQRKRPLSLEPAAKCARFHLNSNLRGFPCRLGRLRVATQFDFVMGFEVFHIRGVRGWGFSMLFMYIFNFKDTGMEISLLKRNILVRGINITCNT